MDGYGPNDGEVLRFLAAVSRLTLDQARELARLRAMSDPEALERANRLADRAALLAPGPRRSRRRGTPSASGAASGPGRRGSAGPSASTGGDRPRATSRRWLRRRRHLSTRSARSWSGISWSPGHSGCSTARGPRCSSCRLQVRPRTDGGDAAGRSRAPELPLARISLVLQTPTHREPHLRVLVDVYALAAPPFGGWGLRRHT